MTHVEPIGPLVTELRSASAVTALVASRIWGQEKRDISPCVVVRQLDYRPAISAPRSGVRDLQVALMCYGTKDPTGDILALQVAGAVGEWIDQRGPRRSATGVAFYRSSEQTTGPVLRDPDTDEPFVIVTATVKVFGKG